MQEESITPAPTGLPEQPQSFGLSRILVIALIILIMGGIGVGAYVLGTQSHTKPVLTVSPTPTTPLMMSPTAGVSLSLSPTQTLDTTSWNTYTNPTEKYMIKYPKGVFTRLNCPNEQLDLMQQDATKKEELDMPTCGRDGRYTIEVTTRTQAPYVPKTDEHLLVKEETVMIDGDTATKYTVTVIKPYEGPSPASWYQEVMFTSKGKYYDFYLGKQEYEKQFSDMLTTFKFL